MHGRGTAGWIRIREAIAGFVRHDAVQGPRHAIFCTYEFDPDVFADELLPTLTRRGRQFHTLVLADQSAFQANRVAYLGGRFNISLVSCPNGGVFHAKLIFLRAGDRMLVGVGSGNLTRGGLGRNLELVSFHTSNDATAQIVVRDALDFLETLASTRAIDLDRTARSFVRRVVEQLASLRRVRGKAALFSSLQESLLTQVERTLAGSPEHRVLHALSPLFATGRFTPDGVDLQAVRRLLKLGGGRLQLFTDLGGRRKGPPRIKGVAEYWVPRVSTDDQSEQDEGRPQEEAQRPTILHAKAYLFEYSNGTCDMFHGSANLTVPALLRSVGAGGNVELLVRSQLARDSTRRFLAELKENFEEVQPVDQPLPKSTFRSARPQGVVLSGTIRPRGRDAAVLALDVRAGRHRMVRVAATRRDGRVRIVRRSKAGWLERGLDLLGLDRVAPDSDSWSTLLWECLRDGSRVPFVVNLPVSSYDRVTEGAGVGEVLAELVKEEYGLWPPIQVTRTNGNPQGDEELDGIDGREGEESEVARRELDAIQHQGELDRIAAQAALLIRRLVYSKRPRDSRLAALQTARFTLKKAMLRCPYRGVVLGWFDDAAKRLARQTP